MKVKPRGSSRADRHMSLPECAWAGDPSVAWWTRETEVLQQRLRDDGYKAKGEGTPEHEWEMVEARRAWFLE